MDFVHSDAPSISPRASEPIDCQSPGAPFPPKIVSCDEGAISATRTSPGFTAAPRRSVNSHRLSSIPIASETPSKPLLIAASMLSRSRRVLVGAQNVMRRWARSQGSRRNPAAHAAFAPSARYALRTPDDFRRSTRLLGHRHGAGHGSMISVITPSPSQHGTSPAPPDPRPACPGRSRAP